MPSPNSWRREVGAMASNQSLPAELTIYTMGELHPMCLRWAGDDDGEPLCLAAQAVDEVDAAGVQLLLSLRNTLAAQGRALHLRLPSAKLAAACAALGALELLTAAELAVEEAP